MGKIRAYARSKILALTCQINLSRSNYATGLLVSKLAVICRYIFNQSFDRRPCRYCLKASSVMLMSFLRLLLTRPLSGMPSVGSYVIMLERSLSITFIV